MAGECTNIDIFSPASEGYTIYTKLNCKYCTQVKELLAKEPHNVVIVSCDAYLEPLASKESFLVAMENWCGREHKTFPFVFFNSIFVGGYTETERYVQRFHVLQDAMDDDDF